MTILISFDKLIGSPDDASLGFLRSDNARRYVRQLPQYPKQNFSARFPNMSPGAVDLLEKMLIFDPNRRITGIRHAKLFPQFYEYLWLLLFLEQYMIWNDMGEDVKDQVMTTLAPTNATRKNKREK